MPSLDLDRFVPLVRARLDRMAGAVGSVVLEFQLPYRPLERA